MTVKRALPSVTGAACALPAATSTAIVVATAPRMGAESTGPERLARRARAGRVVDHDQIRGRVGLVRRHEDAVAVTVALRRDVVEEVRHRVDVGRRPIDVGRLMSVLPLLLTAAREGDDSQGDR